MKNLLRFSRILHLLLIVCFFLPFVPKSCSPSAKEITEKAIADSIRVADSISEAENLNVDSIKAIREIKSEKQNHYKPRFSEKLADIRILHPILRPNEGYSGIGLMIESKAETMYFYTLSLCFILAVITFILSFYTSRRINLLRFLASLTGLICIVLFKFGIISTEMLWGYKSAIILSIIIVFVDLILLLKKRELS